MAQHELLWIQQHCRCHPSHGDQDSTAILDHSPAGRGRCASGIPCSIPLPVPVALQVVGVPGSTALLPSPARALRGQLGAEELACPSAALIAHPVTLTQRPSPFRPEILPQLPLHPCHWDSH